METNNKNSSDATTDGGIEYDKNRYAEGRETLLVNRFMRGVARMVLEKQLNELSEKQELQTPGDDKGKK